MRLLLDSHTVIWSADQPARITPAAMKAMGEPGNDVFVKALPCLNRVYGKDARPNGPSSPGIRHRSAAGAFAFAAGTVGNRM
jgi:hypothetical protein